MVTIYQLQVEVLAPASFEADEETIVADEAELACVLERATQRWLTGKELPFSVSVTR